MDGWKIAKREGGVRKERDDGEGERNLDSIEVRVLMSFCSQVENSRVLHARHGLCKITDH